MSKKSVSEQAQTELPDFVNEVSGLSVEDLNARLATLAKDREELQDAKEADEGLQTAKAEARELGAPYRDGKKVISLKSRFIVSLIKEKGGK